MDPDPAERVAASMCALGKISSPEGRLQGENVKLAFAYGSSVFSQGTQAGKAGMLDLVLAVEDPVEWHRAAIESRPGDYPSFARSGLSSIPQWVSMLQRSGGGRVWFNAGVHFEGVDNEVKYGIIAVDDLLQDLETWDTLYISGRLHKPVRMLAENDQKISIALDANLTHAVHTALLLLPERFDEGQLFRTISNISYAGDVRMMFAESPEKVSNIVSNNGLHFQKLYDKFYETETAPPGFCGHLSKVNTCSSTGLNYLEQNMAPAVRRRIWAAHPLSPHLPPWEMVKSDSHAQCRILSKALARVVSRSSRAQTVKGLVTTGPISAALYGLRKVGKRFGVV